MVIDLRNRLNIYAHRHSQSSERKGTHAYTWGICICSMRQRQSCLFRDRRQKCVLCCKQKCEWNRSGENGKIVIEKGNLTVQRNVNGNTIEPVLPTKSLSTKLDAPITWLVTLPNEHPFNRPGCGWTVLCWYSFRHRRKAVAHCGHPVVLVLRTLSGTPQQ